MTLRSRGLDLLAPDIATREEVEALRAYTLRTMGFVPSSYEFLLRHRPGVFKRKLLMVRMADSEEGRKYQVPNYLAALHYYAVIGYADGILYEIRQARAGGATKGHVLDVLGIAYARAHAIGMNAVATASSQYMDEWQDEPAAGTPFPDGWASDPAAFRSGVDLSRPELSSDERSLIDDWYLRTLGEIPPYVTFLAEYRPSLLKAYRNFIENAIQHGLPNQMLPYVTLYFEMIHGSPDGIREAVLLARGLGMSRDQVVGVMCRAATSYAGAQSLSIAMAGVGDVLRSMG